MFSFKVLVVGDSGVGKTTSVTRFVEGKFLPTKKTIGVDFMLKNVKINLEKSKEIKAVLQLWDFSGEAQFREILPYYVSGAQGVVYMFDSTAPETLINLQDWHEVANKYLPQNVPKLLVSTKHDLKESNVNEETLMEHREIFNYNDYFSSSSVNGENIDKIYQRISDLIVELG
ncbi:MAG: Rab family GTPase [Candidatus Hodarchaeales archaeon]